MSRPAGNIRAARAHAYENARPDVQALVPAHAVRILDLGCASGALGTALKAQRDREVVGVELDPAYLPEAAARLDRVVEADLSAGLPEGLGHFDCVLAADVLEHLPDPWSVLRDAAQLLSPGGLAVISLPNARHWELLWEVGVRGRWPRRDAGIFDGTHLRWFTLAEAYGLCSAAGLSVERVVRMPRPGAPTWTARVRGIRAFGAFQHLITARR